jgi:hypothetical protein
MTSLSSFMTYHPTNRHAFLNWPVKLPALSYKKNEKATRTKKKKNAVLRFLLEITRGHG